MKRWIDASGKWHSGAEYDWQTMGFDDEMCTILNRLPKYQRVRCANGLLNGNTLVAPTLAVIRERGYRHWWRIRNMGN